MSTLKYYTDEEARLPHMRSSCTPAEAVLATNLLCRQLAIPKILVKLTRGSRRSQFRGGPLPFIRYNTDYLTWLVVIHEVAHYQHYRQHYPPTHTMPRKRIIFHGTVHASLMNKLADYVTSIGWMTGTLNDRLAATSQADADKRQAALARVAARRVAARSLDARIAHRQAQCTRLERKIKALGTRLRRARRSLAAMQRVQQHKTAAQEPSQVITPQYEVLPEGGAPNADPSI